MTPTMPLHRLARRGVGLFALLALLLLWPGAGGCDARSDAAAAAGSYAPPEIRVLVESKTAQVTLAADAPPTLEGEALGGGAVRLNLPDVAVSLTLGRDGWRLGDQRLPRGALRLRPADAAAALSLSGRRYRGSLRLLPRDDDPLRFDVVNDLDLESYLAGVLPRELPAHWHAETYAAQAVVARTYAIWELKTAGPGRGYFDVYDSVASQVYGGLDAETAKSRSAVAATRGQVVVHDTPAGPRIFKAYFSSTCGGVTLGVESAFNEPPMLALSAQDLGDSCADSRVYRWPPVVVTKQELTRRLRLWGKRAGHAVANAATVDRLEVADRNRFGRPTRFELLDVRGNRYSLIPEEIRWGINTDAAAGTTVNSGFFTPINNATNIVMSDGRGWGHGVGMCQFGAEHWAGQGKDHVEIVKMSYPGTRVVRAY